VGGEENPEGLSCDKSTEVPQVEPEPTVSAVNGIIDMQNFFWEVFLIGGLWLEKLKTQSKTDLIFKQPPYVHPCVQFPI